MTQVFLTTSDTSPWTRPADWADAGHIVELLGAGGQGGAGSTGTGYIGGGGGGGGAYTKLIWSAAALPSTVPFKIGVGSVGNAAGNATTWLSATGGAGNSLYSGSGGNSTASAAGAAGVANSAIGSPVVTYTRSGNNGGIGGAGSSTPRSGCGGGGAGGPNGVGAKGGNVVGTAGGAGGGGTNGGTAAGNTATTAGGAGGNNRSAAGGGLGGSSGTPAGAAGTAGGGGGGGFHSAVAAANTSGGAGSSEYVFQPAWGCGSGGGGGGGNSVNTNNATASGGDGGIFGGGGGGAGGTRAGTSTRVQGAGISGLIVITYTPIVLVDDAWSAGDKSANITLSNGDKTALSSSGSAGVRSTQTRLNGAAGKYYAELLIDAKGASSCSYGIKSKQTTVASTFETCRVLATDGTIRVDTTIVGGVGSALTAGNIVCVAWDSGTERVWFRKDNGLWNNDAAANPATATNGIDVSSLPNVDYCVWCVVGNAGDSTTVRTELAELSYPDGLAGFVSWMGEALPTGPAPDVLSPSSYVDSSPTIAAAALNQQHFLAPAINVVDLSPVFGTPTLALPAIPLPNAINLIVGGPVVGAPIETTVSHLLATAVAVPSPTIANATFKQIHTLPIATAPVIPAPSLAAGTLTQVHIFAATTDLIVAAASIGTPTLVPLAVIPFTAINLTVAPYSIATGNLQQRHTLPTPNGIAVPIPTIASATLNQAHKLVAQATAAGLPISGVGTLTQVHIFGGAGATGVIEYGSQGAYINYGTRPVTSFAAPAGIANGDLLLAYLFVGQGSVPPATTPPAGWSNIPGSPTHVNQSGFYGDYYVFYKVASGETGGNYDFVHNGTVSSCGLVIRYTGVDTAAVLTATTRTGVGVDATATGLQPLTQTPLSFSPSTIGATTLLTLRPEGTTPAFTERVDQVLIYVADGTLAATGATGNKVHTSNSLGLIPGPPISSGSSLSLRLVPVRLISSSLHPRWACPRSGKRPLCLQLISLPSARSLQQRHSSKHISSPLNLQRRGCQHRAPASSRRRTRSRPLP